MQLTDKNDVIMVCVGLGLMVIRKIIDICISTILLKKKVM